MNIRGIVNTNHYTTMMNKHDQIKNKESSPNEAPNADLAIEQNKGILLEISKESFDKLTNGKFQDMVTEFRDSQKAELEQRQAIFNESGAVKSNVGRMIIPNIQLNEELINSMSNMGDEFKDRAYKIIGNKLLSTDGSISNEDRMKLIEDGLNQAKLLANTNMTDTETDKFINVMERLANIGRKGQLNDKGKIEYNIPRGPLVGAPDDYIDMSHMMKNMI